MKPAQSKQLALEENFNCYNELDQITHIASLKAKQVIQRHEPLILGKMPFEDKECSISNYNPSIFVSLLLNIFLTLIKDTSKEQIGKRIGTNLVANILSTHIKLPLLRLIASIIEKKLYQKFRGQNQTNDIYDEISYSVIFKNCLISFLISVVSQNSNLIGMDKVVNLHKNLMSQNYMLYMPICLYFLYGGSLFTIQKKTFQTNFNKLIKNLSYVLSNQQTIMTHSVNSEMKRNSFQSKVLTDSLNIVCCCMNKEYMSQLTQKICKIIFGERQYIKKQEFIEAVAQMDDNNQCRTFLLFYFDLVRVEFQIIDSKESKGGNILLSETLEKGSQGSFYASQMQKILKKCPYNGDTKCSCKKCQCVRRNRQSAKLSQQKKRNAVEQIQPLKQHIESLQVKNMLLEEQNMMLKGILYQFKNHPQINAMLRGTIEPISKILRDN